MELTICKKVCDECPFRKNSLPGWLGPLTVDETLDAQQFEQLFTCHKTRQESTALNDKLALEGKQPICRGFVLSATISCKVFGQHPINGPELRRLQNENRPTEEDRKLIMARWDFKDHHELKNIKKLN